MAANNFKIQVFMFQHKKLQEFPYNPNITCEDICILCCKFLNIVPPARLLFGLRVENSEKWLTLCVKPKLNVKYEFRMRFKVPELDTLYKIDRNAYEYLYYQIRHDMVNDRISDIRYPTYKDNVVGLGVVDMYIDLLENKGTIASIEKNCKQYLPHKLMVTHKIFAKKKICEGFQSIRRLNRELKYVRSTYMHTISGLAPNYLREYYNATVEHLPNEDADEHGKHYPVTVDLDPFDDDGPGIKVSLKFKKEWLLVTRLENIHALYRYEKRKVHLDISGSSRVYCLEFNRPYEVKSFMSYVSGYFRLMTKWMFDPCVQFVTPSLKELKLLQCHGPVGGDFSYAKIENKGKCGSYIVRQCETKYDTYYIDIFTKENKNNLLKFHNIHIETFKITKERDVWELNINGGILRFVKLTDLASAIPTESNEKFRIPPSEYDKPPLLLICLPKNLLTKKTENELNESHLQFQRVQIFDPKEDLQWYTNSERKCDYGRMTSLLAEWRQPKSKDVSVTLKVLNSAANYKFFMELANTWSQIYSPEFIKIYGITLSTPYTMVMENSEYGPLNEFLFSLKSKVPFECLLEVAHGLVRGIAYMQEKGIYHGQIRCSSLMVTKFDPNKKILVAKISDPGLPRVPLYDANIDLPWIPTDLHTNLSSNEHFDLFSDLWAFATTMWEIFARGQPIRYRTARDLAHNYRKYGAILPMPDECPEEIYQAIMDGWSMDQDKRFNKMGILLTIIKIKQQLLPKYSRIEESDICDDASSIVSSLSNGTEETCQTVLNGNSCSDVRSCTISTSSTRDKDYLGEIRTVQRIPNGRIIKNNYEIIGEGHFGKVFRGEIRYENRNDSEPVAIKVLKNVDHGRFIQDFKREIKIMQTLDHPNIVKIIMATNDEPVSIIMEYLECGSFNVYLSSHKPNLTTEKLLMFSLDIAKGMEYLGAKNIIHRDLAARNILVDRERVKISDFGLAQHANNDGYYISQNRRYIPIKWYAPESISSNKFSIYSDVWSYGVTLFEIFSRGEEPNLDDVKITQVEFLNRLEKGDRLQKPNLCPQIIYDKLMLPCWHKNPRMRPNFTEIIEIVHSIQNESGELI